MIKTKTPRVYRAEVLYPGEKKWVNLDVPLIKGKRNYSFTIPKDIPPGTQVRLSAYSANGKRRSIPIRARAPLNER